MTKVTVAALQMRSGTDPMQNAAAFEALVRDAAGQGAAYIQSPEMTGALVRDRAALEAILKPEAEDPIALAAARLAEELEVVVHVGSTAVRRADGKIANRGFIFGADGKKLASYDKIHMFDVDLDHDESWRESATYTPGQKATVVELPFGRFGMAVCYDVRFPQLFRAQALAGAEVLTMPAAFTTQTGPAHWHVLQRARAIENGAWVVTAAQGGRHEDGRETYGHSLIVDPWGRIVAEADHDEPAVVIAEIDTSASAQARKRVPNLKNARDFSVDVVEGDDDRRMAS